jgi:hypothetical protein
LHRTPLWWEPATVLAALPPRAGFRRSFAAPRSRLEWLDPGRARELIARERPWPRAALSTSATDHDPRAQPLDRPNLAHRGRGRPRSQLFFARPSRVQRVSAGRPIGSTRIASGCASRHGQPRIHGPGAESSLRSNLHLPPRSLASRSFAPTRSPRAPHVAARSDAGWRGLRRRRLRADTDSPSDHRPEARITLRKSPQPRSVRRFVKKGRLTHPPAKGSAIRRTRGAFRRESPPRKGARQSSTTCHQAVDYRLTPLRSSLPPQP